MKKVTANDLIKLAEEYRSDCKQRIEDLIEQKNSTDIEPEDIENQIAHWKATIKKINNVIGG